jgi:hypothetical protein
MSFTRGISRRAAIETSAGLDGGYLVNRNPRPQWHFEVIAGKTTAPGGGSRCFAFVRRNAHLFEEYLHDAVTGAGGNPSYLSVLTDGDRGLRALYPDNTTEGEHVPDREDGDRRCVDRGSGTAGGGRSSVGAYELSSTKQRAGQD